MKQIITHVTHYRYTAPVTYSIQTLRLTPRDDEHQRVLRWHIEAPGALERSGRLRQYHPYPDAEPPAHRHRAARGRTGCGGALRGALGGEDSRLPVHAYCVQTALTQADETILASPATRCRRPEHARRRALARAICDRVAYEPGMTDVTTAANQVLAMGHGVCQDHAHLFLACARGLGVPRATSAGICHRRARRQPRLGRHLAAGRGLDQRGHHQPPVRLGMPLPAGRGARLRLGLAGARRAQWRRRGVHGSHRAGADRGAAMTPPCTRPRRTTMRRGFSPAPIMTYCVAARLNAGLVFLSDSRTNAGWTRSASTAR